MKFGAPVLKVTLCSGKTFIRLGNIVSRPLGKVHVPIHIYAKQHDTYDVQFTTYNASNKFKKGVGGLCQNKDGAYGTLSLL